MSKPLTYSVGIMAYNEERNILRLLDAVLRQKTPYKLQETVVVASGCTDRTCELVKNFSRKHNQIRMLHQPQREGKASAVNFFLKSVQSDLIILESADTLPGDQAFARLLEPFEDPEVGAAGARVLPLNQNKSFLDFYVQLFWELHHQIALDHPKCGELLAFRNCLPGIAQDTATDETWIVALLNSMGYKVVYVPQALVYNAGPNCFRDLALQRIRHMIGYYHFKQHFGFMPKTMSIYKAFKALIRSPQWRDHPLKCLAVVALEALLRFRAKAGFLLLRENPYVWKVAQSTKELPTKSLSMLRT